MPDSHGKRPGRVGTFAVQRRLPPAQASEDRFAPAFIEAPTDEVRERRLVAGHRMGHRERSVPDDARPRVAPAQLDAHQGLFTTRGQGPDTSESVGEAADAVQVAAPNRHRRPDRVADRRSVRRQSLVVASDHPPELRRKPGGFTTRVPLRMDGAAQRRDPGVGEGRSDPVEGFRMEHGVVVEEHDHLARSLLQAGVPGTRQTAAKHVLQERRLLPVSGQQIVVQTIVSVDDDDHLVAGAQLGQHRGGGGVQIVPALHGVAADHHADRDRGGDCIIERGVLDGHRNPPTVAAARPAWR